MNQERMFNSDEILSQYTREDAIADGTLHCFSEWVEINFSNIKTDSLCLSEALVKKLRIEELQWETIMKRLIKTLVDGVKSNKHEDDTVIRFKFNYINSKEAIAETLIECRTSVELFSVLDKEESRCITFGLQGDF